MQSGLIISELTHSAGLAGSSYGRKQLANGHLSITSTQSDGLALGDRVGPSDRAMVGVPVVCDGVDDASTDGTAEGEAVGVCDGNNVGRGLGIIVGKQAGGLPSDPTLNMGWSELHSSGQHTGHPSGNGSILQSFRLTDG